MPIWARLDGAFLQRRPKSGDSLLARLRTALALAQLQERVAEIIADGMSHLSEDNCPFCGQSLKGLALIEAYRRVFGEGYRDMKAAVEETRAVIEREFGDRAIGLLETLIETNRGGAEFRSR
jgi:wobble nucleotide-excising tRNase